MINADSITDSIISTTTAELSAALAEMDAARNAFDFQRMGRVTAELRRINALRAASLEARKAARL